MNLLRVERHERPALAWAFVYFFLLLAAYYVLRPVRDALAVQAGTGQLQWLFTATFLAMLALVPAYGALCAGLALRPAAASQPWAWRLAVLASVIAVSATALGGLFARHVAPQYFLGLGVMGIGLVLAWRRAEVYALSALALAVDTLLVAGLTRLVYDAKGDLGGLFLIGLVACGLLAVSVSLIMRRVRAVEVRA